ncbi:beta-propeller fold lactonase family protein [Astrobacterium formosum]|uniref:beta-propeller fold lactonase family protein n=1 Tax=Astrobacterium formosum TaxID=3069710 RepID=UPI003F50692C
MLPTYRMQTELQPRGFRIDPNGKFLVVAGEKSGWISAYRIDKQTGDLDLLSRHLVGKGAAWVVIADCR